MRRSKWRETLQAVIAAAVALCALAAYAIDSFETKESSDFKYRSIEKRLDRIEHKIDIILQWKQ